MKDSEAKILKYRINNFSSIDPLIFNTLIVGFVFFIRLVVQALTLFIMFDYLGAESFAIFTALSSIVMLASIVSPLGTNVLIVSEVAAGQRSLNSVLVFVIPLTLICSSVMILTCYLLASYFVVNEQNWIFLVIGLSLADVLIHPMIQIVTSELQGREKIIQSQIILLIPLLIKLTIYSISSLLAFDYFIYFSSVFIPLFNLIAFFAIYHLYDKKWHNLDCFRMPTINEVRNTAPYCLINFSTLAVGEFDKILALKFLTLPIAGAYSLFSRIMGALTLPFHSLLVNILPRLFKAKDTNGKTKILKLLIYLSGLYSLLIVILSLFILSFLKFLTEKEVISEIDKQIINLLLIGFPALIFRLALNTFLMGIGKQWLRVLVELTGVVFLIISILFLYKFGFDLSIPIAFVIAEWVMFLMLICIVSSSSVEIIQS